jgi:hypothetical protein
MTSREEKKKTAVNNQSEIIDARIIANYGDPGLDEDYHFDILSRYLVVMMESCDRVITQDKYMRMLAIVQRPPHLWISAAGGISADPSSQNRSDARGNVNVGIAANYSVRGIPRLNKSYSLGDRIKIRRFPMPFTTSTNSTFFKSDFTAFNDSNSLYDGWHSEGSSLPYFSNNQTQINNLRQKTITFSSDSSYYNFYLNKAQYEAFVLTINSNNSILSGILTKIFNGEWFSGTPVYSANGGYVFNNQFSILLSSCEYEDINVDNRIRVSSNECLPLVVATPNSFPTPKQRATGLISYSPSYSPISR